MTPKPFKIIDVLKFGFSALWDNLGRVLLIFIGILFVLIPINALFWIGFLGFTSEGSNATAFNAYSLFAFAAFAFFLFFVMPSAINMAFGRIALDAYDNKKSELKVMVKSLLPLFATYLIVSILFSLLILFGSMLFVIPGIILFFKYNFVDLIVIDTGMGVIDAFKRSNQLTYGHKWSLLVEYVVMNALALLSVITIIGPVVFILAYAFFRAYMYRKLIEAHNQNISQFTAVPPDFA